MIVPTVGRVLHFFTSELQQEPFTALVLRVFDDPRIVNVVWWNGDGKQEAGKYLLLQDEDAPPVTGGFCRWMVYQQGQAAKTEDLAGKLAVRLEALEAQVAMLLNGPANPQLPTPQVETGPEPAPPTTQDLADPKPGTPV